MRPETGKSIVMRKVHLSASARTNNNNNNNNGQRQCARNHHTVLTFVALSICLIASHGLGAGAKRLVPYTPSM